jgi:hypothetical protein
MPRRLSREQRRELILRAAEEQFAATGFASAITVTVANSAGTSEAMVYIHFGTKRKLFGGSGRAQYSGACGSIARTVFLDPQPAPSRMY